MSTSKAAPVARTVAVLVLSVSPVQAGFAAKVSAGETIYGDYCSSCHGEGLKNTSGGVSFDLSWTWCTD
jgi:mono/diheme cytochrome c family protein